MNIKKKKPKYISPFKHISISDEGIGSNRIVISNNYLNNFNYYNKNNIKMLELRKRKYLQNRFESEEFKRERDIPELTYTTSYYIYYNNNKTNNDYIKNDRKNNNFKKAEINYLHDLFQLKSENKLSINLKTNRINRNLKIFDDLISDLNKQKSLKMNETYNINNNTNYNNNHKSYSINATKKERKKIDENRCYNELSGSSYNYKKKKRFNDDLKCKIMFGKTSNDYKKRITIYCNERNNKNNYFNKLNKNNDSNVNNTIKNKIKLKKKSINISKYSNNFSMTNMNSDKEKNNKDLMNISTSYKKDIFEKNQNTQLNDDNNKNNLFPLIK